MNSYIQRVLHYTLDDGDYTPLLQYCINAAVNLMISFPDISRGADGRFIPYDERKIDIQGTVMEEKKFFGNRNTGIEVTLGHGVLKESGTSGTADRITVETYGLPDRAGVQVRSFREPGESRHNRKIELNLTAPQMKSAALIEYFKTAFSTDVPDDEKIYSIKKDAFMELELGEWETAAEEAEYVLHHREDDPDALVVLGSAKIAEGDWRSGRKCLLKAVEILPENPDAWYNLGLAYMKGSDNGSAAHCFEKALEYDPQHHAAHYMKGVILEETGKTDEAVSAYRYAVKFSPGTHKARMNNHIFFTPLAKEALERLGSPWRGDEDIPDPEGVDINEDLVHAASAGDIKRIGSLLKKGAIPDYRSHDKSMHGRTPLIAAALKGDIHAVKYLLDHGAGIDFPDENGCAPLGSVIEWGTGIDMIRLLAENGADVNGRDPYRRPLILNERVLGNPAILDLFANAGADLNAVDEHGANGVYSASAAGNTVTAGFFIEHGADINCRSRSGSVPLMAAVISGKNEMLRFLLAKGGEPDAQDREGRSALMIAAEKADAEAVAILIASGADVNLRDNMGRSAIDIILESGKRDNMEAYRKCVDLLTDAGAVLLHRK